MLTATLRTLEEDAGSQAGVCRGASARGIRADGARTLAAAHTRRLVDWAHSNMVAIMRDRQRHAGGEPAAV